MNHTKHHHEIAPTHWRTVPSQHTPSTIAYHAVILCGAALGLIAALFLS